MIPTSKAYKRAIANDNPQRCLLLFEDAFFTDNDVLVGNGGVHFVEPFCTDKDLTIGQCPSAR